jgi:hypothetical protein
MEFTVVERLILSDAIEVERPRAAYLIYKEFEKFKSDISFSDEEVKEYGLVIEENQIRWDTEKAKPKEIEYNDSVKNLIQKVMKTFDEKGLVGADNVFVYEKIMEINSESA